MVFSSMTFLSVFMPITFLCYYLFKNRTYRNLVLLFFSLFFYAWGEPVYVLLMVFSIVFNWLCGLFIDKYRNKDKPRKAKAVFISSIVINLLLIGVFKYADFIIGSINNLLNVHLPLIKIPLPIGISFYTFQIMTYVIDLWRKEVPLQKDVFKLGAYITMFPQLIAGPIVRYDVVNEALDDRNENISDFTEGIRIFILGLAKKVLIANSMAKVADALLNTQGIHLGVIESWYGMIAYTFQIYYDFSGYSTMAIGLGLMLGFHFPKNFDYPYISRSVTEFWRRWHITLSTFFRDYVYIPLGGNRVSKPRWFLNIFVVWFLTGLWHGASWNFVLWGLYFGCFLVVEKLFLFNFLQRIPKFFGWLYTFVIVVFGWVIFRLEKLSEIGNIIKAMVGFNGLSTTSPLYSLNVLQYLPWFLIAILFAGPVYDRVQKLRKGWGATLVYDVTVFILLLLCIGFMLTSSFNPFIYFRF
ncbi:MAG: MBOAT family protein [Clostridia bacterium]|nr:MBOAT family protein [Clostridia bacterium]